MKKLIIMGLIAVCFLTPALAEEQTKEKPKEFAVYIDKNSRENHYIPSGWMGDYGDIKLNDSSMDNPHSGTTSMQFVSSGKKSQGKGWAGVYWQNPAQNWGSKKGGFDLSGATMLRFWARGEKGGERIEEFKIGGIMNEYSDSDSAGIGPVVLER